MKQAKKIFTRMCLNNWGGINHKVLEFNEYVNLFSGKSGSGKSTVMDAIQVILYGSFSPNFLNKAADDAKNKRSVLSYLRGEQKDGSANREGHDFCSNIVLEIEDTGTHIFTCVGIAFEVRKNDTEIKKYAYFSHSGRMPETEYLTQSGCAYSNKEIRKLVDERAISLDNRGKGDVNRIYSSKEAYLNSLYDVILGYIDGNRFITMEKSAIALKMTNGTGQFIRDYMFPRNTGDIIGKISEQLGAYRDIKEKIDDLKKRIDMLTEIKASGQELMIAQTDILRLQAFLKAVDIKDLRRILESLEGDRELVQAELEEIKNQKAAFTESREKTDEELIQAEAELKSSDLGQKEERLAALRKNSQMLADYDHHWRKVIEGLRQWEEDEVIADYISNPLLNAIKAFRKGEVTVEECEKLHNRIESEKENIEEEYEELRKKKEDVKKELEEKEKLVDDMKNNRKSYSEHLKRARTALENKLTDVYGRKINVYIFADLFDVQEEEWKNAIEGRMGRLKLSLITEPQYAHDAAVYFRDMKQFEEIDLINSKAITESAPRVLENSLYEAVKTEQKFVQICLQRYLGQIIKCQTVEELENVRDGVTPDCYSYSNFIFRHLRKKDYTTNACIGSKVSKARLKEYEDDAAKLRKEYDELRHMEEHFKASRNFESLNEEYEYLVRLSHAKKDLEKVLAEKEKLEEAIRSLKEGKYRKLQERVTSLKEEKKKIEDTLRKLEKDREEKANRLYGREQEIKYRKTSLEEKMQGYVPNEELEKQAAERLDERSAQYIRNQTNSRITELEEKEQNLMETLKMARNRYIFAYPNCNFNGMEKSNEAYESQLEHYLNDYEPKYQAEFEKQCDLIYKSLRENVIATIHGDIKAANRHKNEINRLLRETNFSDSTYQIEIEAAKNENGQFYEMLMAKELDSKNIDAFVCEGQLSFGEDEFYQKYEQKIKLLIDKFMPPRDSDGKLIEQKHREMEQYADYRNYLSFSMYEQVTDGQGNVIRKNFVDEMAGRDSGGEGQNPKYVALLAGFAMLYMQQNIRDSKIRLVLLDEAFSKMDQERSEVCLNYARKMDLQLIVCVPDERLQSLIRNVDSVYGFRRYKNQISMMHIDKGDYLKLMEGKDEEDAQTDASEIPAENVGAMVD